MNCALEELHRDHRTSGGAIAGGGGAAGVRALGAAGLRPRLRRAILSAGRHVAVGPGAVRLYAASPSLLPGTLVYRALRRTPHTLVEDVAMGAAVGLALEMGGWAVFSALGLQGWLWLWPAAVVVAVRGRARAAPALAVRLRARTPLGWSWAVAGIVGFFTAYLSVVFLDRNPILPTSEDTLQYLDLAYQLSLAGEAKHHFPPDLPQVAGEPLYYHWFAYAHMAMTSLVGHIDLPVVALRLAIPALCALAIVLTAVVGWRVSGRPYVGAVAAALFFVVGEVNFTHPVTMPFGTQATFVVWHGMSMIYSWVLLIALIAAAGRHRRPTRTKPACRGWGAERSGWRRCCCSPPAAPRPARCRSCAVALASPRWSCWSSAGGSPGAWWSRAAARRRGAAVRDRRCSTGSRPTA